MSPHHHVTPEQKEAKRLRGLKRAYVAEEGIVLFCILFGIIVAEAIQKRAEGKTITQADFFLDWYNLVIASVGALIYYGRLYINFKDFERKKPALPKRIAEALLAGAGWKALINF